MIDWQRLDDNAQKRSEAFARTLTWAQICAAVIMGSLFALASAQPGSLLYELVAKLLRWGAPGLLDAV